eukprot:6205899-Pleurochrysis_carterae.AAC.1
MARWRLEEQLAVHACCNRQRALLPLTPKCVLASTQLMLQLLSPDLSFQTYSEQIRIYYEMSLTKVFCKAGRKRP